MTKAGSQRVPGGLLEPAFTGYVLLAEGFRPGGDHATA
jgi:hypothetical protein